MDDLEAAKLLFAPLLIGVLINCILYGTMVVQTYIYFRRFKGDPPWFKIFVFYLLLCETVNTLCDIGVVYEPLILRYGTPHALIHTPIMLAADGAMTVMISTPVQLFIAWRVRILSRSIILPAIISVFAILSFASGIATSVAISVFNEFTEIRKCGPRAITWLASSASADFIITGSLVYFLLCQRTGFAATDDLVSRIIRMTVQTGSITSLCALMDLIIPAFSPHSTLNFVFDFALSKLYSNSLLSTLNARGGWRTTSSFRNNALFGTEAGSTRSRTQFSQIEIVATDPHAQESSNTIPMKAFDSNAGIYHEDAKSGSSATPQPSDDV